MAKKKREKELFGTMIGGGDNEIYSYPSYQAAEKALKEELREERMDEGFIYAMVPLSRLYLSDEVQVEKL